MIKHTKETAETEAFKRNKHMGKHQTNVRWAAVHDSVNGWQVKLVTVHGG